MKKLSTEMKPNKKITQKRMDKKKLSDSLLITIINNNLINRRIMFAVTTVPTY